MISWPDELVTDIARRKTVIVLGAGISMNAKTLAGRHPKNWVQLLEEGAKKIGAKPRSIVRRLLKERDYLTACEILKMELGKDNYESFLTEEFLTPQFIPARVHESIFNLDSRIVATPNIDKIYETFAHSEAKGSIKTKHFYDEDVANAIRRSNRLVLKIHGSIDSPGKLIFTRGEYATARIKYAEFYSILDALLVTSTFVFLGCGVNDPDIRLLLENYTFRFLGARRHFITMAKDALSQQEIKVIEDSMNLKILTYNSKDNHKELIDSIAQLQKKVDSEREQLATSMDW